MAWNRLRLKTLLLKVLMPLAPRPVFCPRLVKNGPDCLAGVVEGVDPLAEALRRQELLQGDRDRDRLVVEGRERRQRRCVLIGAERRDEVGQQVRAAWARRRRR